MKYLGNDTHDFNLTEYLSINLPCTYSQIIDLLVHHLIACVK